MRNPKHQLAAALTTIALLVAGCGGADESDAAPTDAPAQDDSARLDSSVFQGQAELVNGESIDLAELADQDLVLWFWAPW